MFSKRLLTRIDTKMTRSYSKEILFRELISAKITCYNNKTGLLSSIIKNFADHEINLISIQSHIQNKRADAEEAIDFHITYVQPVDINRLHDTIFELNQFGGNLSHLPIPSCNSFPVHLTDLDELEMIKHESEVVNEEDPIYTDKEYKKRRTYLASINGNYKMGTSIKRLDY